MSMSENKDIVRRLWYDELWNNWNIGAADDLFTADYVLHLPGSPPINRDGAKQVVAMFARPQQRRGLPRSEARCR